MVDPYYMTGFGGPLLHPYVWSTIDPPLHTHVGSVRIHNLRITTPHYVELLALLDYLTWLLHYAQVKSKLT